MPPHSPPPPCVDICVLSSVTMQSRQYCRKSPPQPQPPRWFSNGARVPTADPQATFISPSSPLPCVALTPQRLHSSAKMQPPVIPRQAGAPAASALTSPLAVSSSHSLPADSTVLSVHSAASGSISRIGVRDVAELVRHLAESRYMTRQLQQRVHQMESSFSVKAEAIGNSTLSDVPTQRSTKAAAQGTDERLATSDEAKAAAAAGQATLLHSHNQGAETSKRRQCPANAQGGELTCRTAPTSARAAKKTRRVSAAFRRSRSDDSSSPRSPYRCSSLIRSSLPVTASATASATTSSLPSTSPPSSIAESPVRRGAPSQTSRCASNESFPTTSPRHGRDRTSRKPHRPPRTHSAPERPRQRARSGIHSRRDTAVDVPCRREEQHRRGSAKRHRTHTRLPKHRHHKAHDNEGNRTTAASGGGAERFASYGASVSLTRYHPRSSATELGRHRRLRSAAGGGGELEKETRCANSAAALPAPGETRVSSSRREKALVWQRRYYELLARYTDDTTRRDADLADIHEMIEYISWEQDRSRHCHRQQHHTRTVQDEVEGKGRLPSQDGAAPQGSVQGVVGAGDTARNEPAVATPLAVAPAHRSGTMATEDDDGNPGGHATPGNAAAPVHDALEYIEALRCEADAWRQRCLALLQQQHQPQQRLGAEATWVSDASVAPLPPRPSSVAAQPPPLALGTALTSRHVELLMSTNTSTVADEEAGVMAGGGDSACERAVSTAAAAHPSENAVPSKASSPPLPSYPSAPAPMVAQATQLPLPGATAAAGVASSSARQLCHPYAPPRLVSASHISSVGAAKFEPRFLTPPPLLQARPPVQLAGGAPSPPASSSSPVASSLHPSPAKQPLFVGVPGYQPLNPHYGSRTAWSSQALSALPPSGKALPYRTNSSHPSPATTSVFIDAPPFDTSAASAWADVVGGGVQKGHVHKVRSTSPWPLDATLERQCHSHLPASSPASVPEAFIPHPPTSSLFHVSPPLPMAPQVSPTREQLERDIRRHDQLLAAIGKLQKTAAEHAMRRGL
ncbi:conserved hypothetical protein [Leishmania braziliensis MHOM/BR/75/M2904]|uniref:Uncharacterized protein n=1 Tax=Leishmania braziliensis TaxID=5660 RepID=A4H8J3_LEIBR|nr:conserved hypothetical protein [Leishmania braziliensis MHOM/BR/75/M2904]CAJ2469692.1 unnamed protein product [Leishmania braziliensis]CAM37709.1 conserved hypothetical protein [Leishmania braziliensis MHOM/BR/75/M2904]